MSKVCIIGGGAAGMMAAIAAARNGHEVHLYEKNEKLGKKLFITGKGRCNLTNACDMEALFEAVTVNEKFLYSSFYTFSNTDVIAFFESLGMKTKIERGGRVFPVSDHASDVIRSLEKALEASGVRVHLNAKAEQVAVENGSFQKVVLEGQTEVYADACIIATGGLSYPATGSTGDGYTWAKLHGHRITRLCPSLVPMQTKEHWVKELQGLSLRNVQVSIYDGKKLLYREFGELLFTHYGVSGPVILSASSVAGDVLTSRELLISIDLKPALTTGQLDARVLRDFEEQKNKQFKNSLGKLFPSKLIPVMIALSGIDPEKKIHTISKEERKRLLGLIQNFQMTAVGLRGFEEAIITKGGVAVTEVDPGTMESKKIKNLYFSGEVLDLDGVTGGFNLQIAWSTGYMAGQGVR